MTSTLSAYHGKHTIKRKFVKRVDDHLQAAEIIHGGYWNGERGCAIGCTIHSSDHAEYESVLGIPRWLAILEDYLFEHMKETDSYGLPGRLLEAIPIGYSNWNALYHDFCAFVLREVAVFDRDKYARLAKEVDRVARLHDLHRIPVLRYKGLDSHDEIVEQARTMIVQSGNNHLASMAPAAALVRALSMADSEERMNAIDMMADWLIKRLQS